jgi:hypothetical protein
MLRAFQIAVILAAAVLFLSMLGIGFYSSPPSNNPTNQQTIEQKPGNQEQEDRMRRPTFWQWLFPDAISVFTFWLAISTVGLGIIAIIQLGFLNRQETIIADMATAAKNSADAAKQSADTVVNVERPYIFVAAKPVSVVPKDGPDQPAPKISYSVTNMRRVPAVIRLLYAQCTLIETLSPKQTVDRSKFRTALTAIGGGLTNLNWPVCEFEKPFTAEDWVGLRSGKKIAIFEAAFVYEGALDFTYVTSLAYRIDLFTGDAFAIGGSPYNYDESERGRFSKTDKMTFSKMIFSQPTPSSTQPNR